MGCSWHGRLSGVKTCVICDGCFVCKIAGDGAGRGANNRSTCSNTCRAELRRSYKRTPKYRLKENERRRRKDRPPCPGCGRDISERPYQATLCEPCSRIRALDQVRNANHQRKYGISMPERQALVDAQGGLCASCGIQMKPQGHSRPYDGAPVVGVVDHCHDTGKVRGILCAPCNFVEGHIRNGRVAKLQKYLGVPIAGDEEGVRGVASTGADGNTLARVAGEPAAIRVRQD